MIEAGDEETLVEVVLDEGKFRQIRRSFEAIGIEVRTLHRIAIGPLELGELAVGEAAPLTPEELATLRAATRGG